MFLKNFSSTEITKTPKPKNVESSQKLSICFFIFEFFGKSLDKSCDLSRDCLYLGIQLKMLMKGNILKINI